MRVLPSQRIAFTPRSCSSAITSSGVWMPVMSMNGTRCSPAICNGLPPNIETSTPARMAT